MKTAGYSGKPLVAKLGYQPGQTVYVVGAPDWFLQELTHNKVQAAQTLPADWAHLFVTSKQSLEALCTGSDPVQLELIARGLWVSWPKKASGVATDITEQTLRDLILPLGWVDIKVAAIDDTWSGLKFTRRRS